MIVKGILSNRRGAAAAEMALILPVLLLLLFGGVEGGHFIWTQHKVTKAVRNGARFAARLPEVAEVCDPASKISDISDATRNQIRLYTRTETLDESLRNNPTAAVVPYWSDAQVEIPPIACEFSEDGIYRALGAKGPIVTVRATGVPYRTIFGYLGGFETGITLTAESHAAGTGL